MKVLMKVLMVFGILFFLSSNLIAKQLTRDDLQKINAAQSSEELISLYKGLTDEELQLQLVSEVKFLEKSFPMKIDEISYITGAYVSNGNITYLINVDMVLNDNLKPVLEGGQKASSCKDEVFQYFFTKRDKHLIYNFQGLGKTSITVKVDKEFCGL